MKLAVYTYKKRSPSSHIYLTEAERGYLFRGAEKITNHVYLWIEQGKMNLRRAAPSELGGPCVFKLNRTQRLLDLVLRRSEMTALGLNEARASTPLPVENDIYRGVPVLRVKLSDIEERLRVAPPPRQGRSEALYKPLDNPPSEVRHVAVDPHQELRAALSLFNETISRFPNASPLIQDGRLAISLTQVLS